MTNYEPNAAVLIAFAGAEKVDEKHEQAKAERQEILNTLRVLTEQREREEKRLAGLAKAQETRRQKRVQKQA